jgi:CTP synthase
MFCHVAPEQVLGVHDMASVYHVPLLLQSQGIVEFLGKRLKLGTQNGNGSVPQVNISEEMKLKGRTLEARWKELTSRRVINL